jgi:hypothetical protein
MPDKLPPNIRFHYLKNPQFRVVHVDGAIGGITPRGLIHCAVYSERPAIPQSTVQDVTPEGRLGDETGREGREGIVREIDVDLMLTKQAATELRDWLDKRVNELTEIEKNASRTKAGA